MHIWRNMMFTLLMLCWLSPVGADNATFIDQLHQAYAKVLYFEADFIQEKQIKHLSKPLISKGKIIFAKQQGMIWEVTEPVWVRTKIQDNQIFKTTQYYQNKKVNDVQMKAVAQILTELLSSQLDRVESQFDISDLNLEQQNGMWQVKLTPQVMMLKKSLSSLEITGQLANGSDQQGINQITIFDKSDNQTQITFESVRIENNQLTQDMLNEFQ